MFLFFLDIHLHSASHIKPISMDEPLIMKAFREGDKEAFKFVFKKLSPSLSQYTRQKVHSMGLGDDSDADDHVAECFYKLYINRESKETIRHITRWCFLIIKRQLIDKQRIFVKSISFNDEAYYLDSGFEEQNTFRINQIKILNSCVEKLPMQRKLVIKMIFFEKKDTTEIANKLRLSRQTVLNHKTKAIEELRRLLYPHKEYIFT